MIDPKNENWMGAPLSAVITGLKHFGKARSDRPFCHGHRVQVIDKGTPKEKQVKHFLNFRKEKASKVLEVQPSPLE